MFLQGCEIDDYVYGLCSRWYYINIISTDCRLLSRSQRRTWRKLSAESCNHIRAIKLAPDYWIFLTELSDQFPDYKRCLDGAWLVSDITKAWCTSSAEVMHLMQPVTWHFVSNIILSVLQLAIYYKYKVSRLRLYKMRVLKYCVENKAELETWK